MPRPTYRTVAAFCFMVLIAACGGPQQVEVTRIVEQTTIVKQTVVVGEIIQNDIATPKPTLEVPMTPSIPFNQSIVGHWHNPGTGEEIKFLSNGLLIKDGLAPARYNISADGTHLTRKTIIFPGVSNEEIIITTTIELNGDELILDTTTSTISTMRRVSPEITLTDVEKTLMHYLQNVKIP